MRKTCKTRTPAFKTLQSNSHTEETPSLTIALDAMGGDMGPAAVLPGAALALQRRPDLKFMIFGDEAQIRPYLADLPKLAAASTVFHTDKKISSEEKPSVALRSGRESSMRLAIDAVANKQAQAIVSSGNTGALMAIAKLVLRCLPNIHRPAIASQLPTREGRMIMLDLGANVDCDAEMLVQFALMGSVFARIILGVETPRVGLLNVGSEDMKGHEELREAASVLQNLNFQARYCGFVEGNNITDGSVDVIVTDGFTGNIALKTVEGTGKLAEHYLRQALTSSPLAMLGAFLCYGALKGMKRKLDPRLYNGGMLLGLNGICVKSHGGSDATGFATAVISAAELAANNYNARVALEIEELLKQNPTAQSSDNTPPSEAA